MAICEDCNTPYGIALDGGEQYCNACLERRYKAIKKDLAAARERAERAEEALLQIWNCTPLSDNVFWPNSVKQVVIELWDALTLPEKADKIAAWQQANAAAGIEEPHT